MDRKKGLLWKTDSKIQNNSTVPYNIITNQDSIFHYFIGDAERQAWIFHTLCTAITVDEAYDAVKVVVDVKPAVVQELGGHCFDHQEWFKTS
jgi:hypothetical protein